MKTKGKLHLTHEFIPQDALEVVFLYHEGVHFEALIPVESLIGESPLSSSSENSFEPNEELLANGYGRKKVNLPDEIKEAIMSSYLFYYEDIQEGRVRKVDFAKTIAAKFKVPTKSIKINLYGMLGKFKGGHETDENLKSIEEAAKIVPEMYRKKISFTSQYKLSS